MVALATAALILPRCAAIGLQRPEPFTVDQVVAASRAGEPAPEIIARMRDSGTVYRLSGSQLASLRDEGVPDAVLDYMQETYLAAVRRREELAGWDGWTGIDGYWYGGAPYGWPDEWIGDVDVSAGHDDDAD
jgi:hypothetical protein